jgi:hypothetical protein
MKNTTLPFLFFAFLSVTALYATPQQTAADERPAIHEPPMAQRLALSHEQRLQFRTINQDRKAQLNAVQADTTLSPRARREKNRDINATAENKIRSILNQNQQDEYDQIKRERHEQKVRRQETITPAPEPPATNPPQ